MNGVFLALGLIHGHADLRVLRDIWLRAGSFDQLLRDPIDTGPPSLLKGDDYFLVELERAIALLVAPPRAAPDPESLKNYPIDLQLTITALDGQPDPSFDARGTRIVEKRHRFELRFRRNSEYDDFCATSEADRERVVARMARACRSTASFPGAFEPSRIHVAEDDVPSSGGPRDEFLRRHARDLRRPGAGPAFLVIDGGTLVNLPVEAAIDAIFEQPPSGAVRRVFALIVPDPSISPPVADANSEPALSSVIAGALSSIPRNQSVGDFLTELSDLNRDTDRLRAARARVLRVARIRRAPEQRPG